MEILHPPSHPAFHRYQCPDLLDFDGNAVPHIDRSSSRAAACGTAKDRHQYRTDRNRLRLARHLSRRFGCQSLSLGHFSLTSNIPKNSSDVAAIVFSPTNLRTRQSSRISFPLRLPVSSGEARHLAGGPRHPVRPRSLSHSSLHSKAVSTSCIKTPAWSSCGGIISLRMDG